MRNVNFIGSGAGSTGISLGAGGYLVVQNSSFKFLTTGLNISGKADLINADITANTTGILTQGTGVPISNGVESEGSTNNSNAGLTEVRLSHGNVLGNTTAFNVMSGGTDGSGNALITIWFETISGSQYTTTNVAGNSTMTVLTGSTSCTNTCWAYAGYYFQGQNTIANAVNQR